MKDRQSLLTQQSQVFLTQLQKQQNSTQLTVPVTTQKKQRLISLDILRGLTMFGMLFVDDLMQGPWWLQHPAWNGFTFADLIFPSFLFCMGMAVPLAITKTKPLRPRNIFRIVGLFGIGVLLALFQVKFNFYEFRVMGILQRIALCYGVLSLLHAATNYGQKSYRFIGVLLTSAFVMIYLTFMLTFDKPEEGCPKENNLEEFCNFGAYWDRKMFTESHMIYPSDPQGLFTTLTSFMNAYAGYWFCLTMFEHRTQPKKTVKIWIFAASLCALTALPLVWLMPLNKKIWSVSYAFLTIGTSGITLSLITIIFDIIGKDSPRYKKVISVITTPFLWFGRNPLALFMSRDFLDDLFNTYIVINDVTLWQTIYNNLFKSWIDTKEIASVLFSLFLLIFFTIEAYILFRNNIFIRL